jgi:hypothetical protein
VFGMLLEKAAFFITEIIGTLWWLRWEISKEN